MIEIQHVSITHIYVVLIFLTRHHTMHNFLQMYFIQNLDDYHTNEIMQMIIYNYVQDGQFYIKINFVQSQF